MPCGKDVRSHARLAHIATIRAYDTMCDVPRSNGRGQCHVRYVCAINVHDAMYNVQCVCTMQVSNVVATNKLQITRL